MADMITRSSVAKTGFVGEHRLIQDTMPLRVLRAPEEVMVEDAHGNKRKVLRLGGQFQFADRPNANGRIYDRSVLAQSIQEIRQDVVGRRVLGELDHPSDAKIHMDRVSHLVTRLELQEDGSVYGELEVLRGTIMGDQLAALIENGVTVGISSRGVGDLEDLVYEGARVQRVLEGFTLVTFDVVGEPSVDGSFLSVMEARERALRKGGVNLREQSEQAIAEALRRYLRR